MRKIVVYSLLTLLIASCDDKPAKTNQTKIENSAVLEENSVVDKKAETNLDVIFSTENLESAKWNSPDEYPLKIIGHDGGIYDNVDNVIRLPDYNKFEIIIWSTEGGDDIPYTLCVVKEKIINVNSGLNITPHWSEPGNDENNYSKKTFKIYKDYTIEINTEEKKEDSEVQKYTKRHKINNDGSFYELKLQ
jgi:hypothetical protein